MLGLKNDCPGLTISEEAQSRRSVLMRQNPATGNLRALTMLKDVTYFSDVVSDAAWCGGAHYQTAMYKSHNGNKEACE